MDTTAARNSRGAPERRGRNRLRLGGFSSISLICGERLLACRVADLSLSGLGLDFAGEPPELGAVALEHATAGRIEGRAVWTGESRIGIQLDIAGSDLERVLQCLNIINAAR